MSRSPSSARGDGIPRAATLVMLRDGGAGPKVFMVRRHGRAAWAGAHVFPGGRVDAADRDAADDRWCDGVADLTAQHADLPAVDAVAHYVAAARELFEEAGVLLARDATRHRRTTKRRRQTACGLRRQTR